MKFIHFIEQKEKISFLQRVRAFRYLPHDQLNAMANVMRWQTIEADTELISQGQAINDVYFIAEGVCRASCKINDEHFAEPIEVFLGEYRKLDLVGEEAVLRDRQLAADQPKSGPVKLVFSTGVH